MTYYEFFNKYVNFNIMDYTRFLNALSVFIFLWIVLFIYWKIMDNFNNTKKEREANRIVTSIISQRTEVLESSPKRNFRIESEKEMMKNELKIIFKKIEANELDNLVERFYPDKPNINFMY